MSTDLSNIRNIGISAHIDSGKTTLTERILFYTNRIHAIHEVRGKDGVGAKMDSMELERERGITIQSAATYTTWKDTHINIIDTPGHVDFTIEVERALRVLDGAILVLCGVAGVQSQSITVDRQMRRYNVPRIAFVNKLDRQGANPMRVCKQLREKLKLNAVMIQYPIGLEEKHVGVVDLVKMKALFNEGDNGETIREADIPEDLVEVAEEHREMLLDAVSMFSDELMEQMMEEAVQEETLMAAVRAAVIANELCPVFCGSAFKNKGVQPMLDGVSAYLPCPTDVENRGVTITTNKEDEQELVIDSDPSKPLVALAFKLEQGQYGQLTYLRIYQGTLSKGEFIHNMRDRKKVKVGRLVRMHSDEMEDIESACAGDIVALFGVDCHSGDTFTDGSVEIAMTSMHVPDPVIHYTINAESKHAQNLSKALQRFSKEDPTFRVAADPETGETVISGMGELHLDVYIERMRREYKVPIEVSPPRVAYRETITRSADFNYTHKKQTGGSGQYGRVAGTMSPTENGEVYEFVDKIVGGSIPREYIPSCDKGFRQMLDKGLLIGQPVTGVRMMINDGAFHAVDSSDMAFQAAAKGAWRETYHKAGPVILEPIMRVDIEGPAEFQGNMVGTIMSRRGLILNTTEEDGFCRIESEVPLSEMFGYSTALRSNTQGKAEFAMEFSRYAEAPKNVADDLVKKYQEEQDKKRK
ncbi:MAG: elongation factor G [Myxococcales bacterium]|nr:elongation factor G [Myxococcales bacterium]MCB9669864.1 elongation factor G [Alphaproteobacteria bacterium]MCB9693262.1 elongation factor G [Alphaproteobacteria bacterium]